MKRMRKYPPFFRLIFAILIATFNTNTNRADNLVIGPFKIIEKDGGNETHSCKSFSETERLKYKIRISSTHLLPENGRNITDDECDLPMYLYAYWGDDFADILNISDPITLSDFTPEGNGILSTVQPFLIDYSILPESLCESEVNVDVEITVSLVYYDLEQGFLLYPGNCPIFSSQDLIPNSHIDVFRRTICCGYPVAEFYTDDRSQNPPGYRYALANEIHQLDKQQDLNQSDVHNGNHSFTLQEDQSFPNPCRNVYNLSIRSFYEEMTLIKVLSSSGQICDSLEILLEKEQKVISINTENLIPGIYYIVVVSNNWTENLKILKI